MRSGLCRTTLTTHVDVEAYTVFGAPMQLSTAIIPSGQCSNASLSGPGSECAHGRCDEATGLCGPGVGADDILLAPSDAGSIRLNGALTPVKGDLKLQVEGGSSGRLVVRKQRGALSDTANRLILEHTKLTLLSPVGAECVAACRAGACPAGVAEASRCTGSNTLEVLDGVSAPADNSSSEWPLSLSDVRTPPPPPPPPTPFLCREHSLGHVGPLSC